MKPKQNLGGPPSNDPHMDEVHPGLRIFEQICKPNIGSAH
jgi:hypothetical protein